MTSFFLRRTAAALLPILLIAAAGDSATVLARDSAAATAPVNPQTDAARAWNFAASDLAVDPNIIFGVLPNGMKYALLKNGTPKNSVIIRMRLNAGSLAAADDRRRLA